MEVTILACATASAWHTAAALLEAMQIQEAGLNLSIGGIYGLVKPKGLGV